jgi:hypothetical protein
MLAAQHGVDTKSNHTIPFLIDEYRKQGNNININFNSKQAFVKI